MTGSLNPKIMSLLPRSSKIITSAPQLPEKKQLSPQIPKAPGGQQGTKPIFLVEQGGYLLGVSSEEEGASRGSSFKGRSW